MSKPNTQSPGSSTPHPDRTRKTAPRSDDPTPLLGREYELFDDGDFVDEVVGLLAFGFGDDLEGAEGVFGLFPDALDDAELAFADSVFNDVLVCEGLVIAFKPKVSGLDLEVGRQPVDGVEGLEGATASGESGGFVLFDTLAALQSCAVSLTSTSFRAMGSQLSHSICRVVVSSHHRGLCWLCLGLCIILSLHLTIVIMATVISHLKL